MKKTTIIAAAAFLLFTASVNAQTDTTAKDPSTTTTSTSTHQDKYNNWSPDTYKLQPMPEALTTEKIFPVLGKYQLTDKDGNASTVTISLDPSNKGLVWIDGLPQGQLKAALRKSPAVYKIPAQKVGEEADAKDVAEGVLIYDKDANLLNVCIGCTYNSEDPAVAFNAAPVEEAQPEEAPAAKTKTTKTSKKAVAKVTAPKIVPMKYSGNKIIETTAAVSVQQ